MKYLFVVFLWDNKVFLNLVKLLIDMVLFDFFFGIWLVNFIFFVGFEWIYCMFNVFKNIDFIMLCLLFIVLIVSFFLLILLGFVS